MAGFTDRKGNQWRVELDATDDPLGMNLEVLTVTEKKKLIPITQPTLPRAHAH